MKTTPEGDEIPSRDEDRPTAIVVKVPVDDPAGMEAFQEFMDQQHDAMERYEARVMLELGISRECASDVAYLRSRSRWTEGLEKELIRLHAAGDPPNIFEWPDNSNGESQ